jgi:hypothetical protein
MAWVAVLMLVCTGITFVAVYRGTGTQLRHQIDQEIAGDAGALSRTLTSTEDSYGTVSACSPTDDSSSAPSRLEH